MNRLQLHKIILILVLASLWACNKDNHTAIPVVRLETGTSYISSDTSVEAGTLMRFKVSMMGDGFGITNFLVRLTTDTMRTVFDTGLYVSNAEWEGSFFRGFYETENWAFLVRDRWGNETSVSVNVQLDAGSNFKPLENIRDITLGAQDNPETGSFYSFDSCQSYFTTPCNDDPLIQAVIDLVFYHGDDLSTIASPGANIESGVFEGDLTGWKIRNTTRLMKTQFSQEDFNSLENDSVLIATYDESLAKRKAKALQAGDNYIFRLSDEKLGIFLVKEVVGGPTGRIVFDAKLQAVE